MAENMAQVQEVSSLYLQILQNLNMSTTPEWLQLDLTFQQMKVLYVLKHYGTLKMKELHEKLGVSMPTITGIVNRLVERKDGVPLLSREASPEDRREVWTRLTPAGVETTELLNDLNARLVEKAVGRLDKAELNEIKASLQQLLEVVVEQRHEMGEDTSEQPKRPLRRTYNRSKSTALNGHAGQPHLYETANRTAAMF